MPTHSQDNTINASPTKEFFISMLIKDIALSRAIIDLVDNSVDGARRLRADKPYKGLWVRVEVTKDLFRIADNCGGISVDLARDYAFRFGRSSRTPSVTHSIGQFGVGMKRALFKIGNRFRIESVTTEARYVVEVDVNEWKQNPDPKWSFAFTEGPEMKTTPLEQTRTTIEVTSLHPSVARDFELENFVNALKAEMEAAHQNAMGRGLSISLNQIPLHVSSMQLLQSDELRPARKEMSLQNGQAVKVLLFAGISESDPEAAGWYVFCNGRMVLEADQSKATGWGERKQATIPKFHNQFARFRGFAFFDSDDAGLLPWNTTKTGVDEDSPRFRAVRQEILTLTRPVIDFLNKLDAEKDQEKQPLLELVEAAAPTELSQLQGSEIFDWAKIRKQAKAPQMQRIQYDKPVNQVTKVMAALDVQTYKEVGERTFEYFFDLECE